MLVDIPETNLAPLRKRIHRLAVRALNLGMPCPTMTVVSGFTKQVEVPDHFGRLRGDPGATRLVSRVMAKVSIEGASPWIDDWEVVGTRHRILMRDRKSRVIDYGQIPESKVGSTLCCDHCGTNRKRARSYFLRRRDEGKELEVGSDCLVDFFGSGAGPRVLEGLDLVSSVVRDVAEASDPYWRHGGKAEIHEEGRLVLAVTNRVIQESGWISSSRARVCGIEATWRTVAKALELSRSEEGLRVDSPVPLAADFLAADEAMEWFRSRKDDVFLAEVAEVIDRGMASSREIAVLAAGMSAYRRDIEKRASRRVEEVLSQSSSHVGTVGDRIERVVTVRKLVTVETNYGPAVLVAMNDADGNLISWFTKSDKGLKAGHCYEIKGTVKEHARMKSGPAEGAPETRLLRVTIIAELGPGYLGPVSGADLSESDAAALDELVSGLSF